MTSSGREQTGPVVFKLIERPGHTILWFRIDTEGWLAAGDLSAVALPRYVPAGEGVTFTGVGPTWLYCHLVRLAAQSGAFVWVGTFEPRLCRTVIVWSSDPDRYAVGQIVPGLGEAPDVAVTPGPAHDLSRPPLGYALAVVGPPHSGKSVLVAGFQRLLRRVPRTWVYRATPDGEGLWSQESQEEHARHIRHPRQWTGEFRQWNLAAVQLLKQTCDLLFVDTGGKMSADTADLLRLCGKAVILVSARAEKEGPGTFAKWRSFCTATGAEVVAELASDLDAKRSEIRGSDGPIAATVAGLDRGNTKPEKEVAPVLNAIMNRLELPDFA
jgi:CRISPR-associated protein Csx3